MKKFSLILLLLTTFLYAETDNVTSKLFLDSESFELDHESAYGVTNSYSFLVMEHHIQTESALVLHYGTRVGVVFEDYTATNGFGPNSDQYGTIIEANLGFDYDIQEYQTLSFKGSRSQNDLEHLIGTQLRVMYEYKF